MNQQRHKVIFNKTRGVMMAVAEYAMREGKTAGERDAGNGGNGSDAASTLSGSFSGKISGSLSGRLSGFSIPVLTFSLLLGFGLAAINTADAGGIEADPAAPRNQQPVVLQTANGLEQVNIQTPSAAGVSVNQYRRFDVDGRGVILNNSHRNIQTRQAGWIQGNPFLARGEARIIVNQVNSADPSLLNGYVEIAGRRAEMVLANPAGIQINGGGFINSAGVTLTTGRPIIHNGVFEQIQVRGGSIGITGQGLDARDTDYTRILSQAAHIQAGIWGQNLHVVAGQNDIAADGHISGSPNTAPANPASPAVAIDTGALGGMYAGKITLISTDRGSSIQNAGQLFAQAGGVSLNADGIIRNSGSIVAAVPNHNGTADTAAVSVRSSEKLDNSGTLSAQGQTGIHTPELYNSGSILSAHTAKLHTGQTLANSGRIQAARLDIDSPQLTNHGKIQQTGLQGLAIHSRQADNRNHGLIGYTPQDNSANPGGSNPANPAHPTQPANPTTPTNPSHPGTAAGSGSVAQSQTAPVVLPDGRIQTDRLLNDGGQITANGAADLTVTQQLDNQAELALNRLQAGGQKLNNQHGQIRAQQAELTANQTDNRHGSIDAGRLSIRSPELDNRSGRIRSNHSTELQISGSLDNRSGQISSAQNVSIHDNGQNSLRIDNSQGSILAGNDAAIQAKDLTGSGTLAAGRDIAIRQQDNLTSSNDIEAGRHLSLTTAGRLSNRHRLLGAESVQLQAADIDNTAAGSILAGNSVRLNADTLANRGLINSNGQTHLSAQQRLDNIGSGRIYGNHVALATAELHNREETSANGQTQAATIAARERLDIGAGHITNREGALIASEGRLFIGGTLDDKQQAVGIADTLTNSSARIEAKGSGRIAARQLDNLNPHFATETYVERSRSVTAFGYVGQPDPFFTDGVDGHYSQSDKNLDLYFNDGRHQHFGGGAVKDLRRYDYTESVVKERITENKPAEILIGGDLQIEGSTWNNDNSFILAGGQIQEGRGLTLNNPARQATEQFVTSGSSQAGSFDRHGKWGTGKRKIRFDQGRASMDSVRETHYDFSAPISAVEGSSAKLAGHTQPVGTEQADTAGSRPPLPQQIHSLADKGSLPTSSLYSIDPNRAGYLIETDPAFADYRKWLNSDYMLQALTTDSDQIHKRLGDGYYEQRLINEQIARLTGYRRLDGYQNDEEQFKALMDAGITFARAQNLVPGIALSREQVARLTSDIVWLENQTVTLADGSRHTVLVPKVYVLARQGDVNRAGGLISAEQIRLGQLDRLDNGGTIAGRRIVDLGAQNLDNRGSIQGGKVRLQAQDTLNNTGGRISAEDALLLQAQNINLISITSTTGDAHNGRTVLDRVAGLYVTGGEGGQLVVDAAHNLQADGAEIANRSAGGQTVLQAGNALNLGTVGLARHESSDSLSDRNHRHVHQSAEAGSTIHTDGSLILSGRDVSLRQAELSGGQGKVHIQAQNSLTVGEGRRTLDLDESVYSKNRNLFRSKSYQDHYRRRHDEAHGSTITGEQVVLSAGQDLTVRGSNVIAQDKTVIAAGGRIDLTAARNDYQDRESHERTRSGLTASFKDGVASAGYAKSRQQTEQQGSSQSLTLSQIGSIRGDTTIAAERQLTAEAARLAAGGNLHLQGSEVNLNAAYTDSSSHREAHSKQSGFALGVTYDAYTAGKHAWDRSMQGGGYSDSIVGNWMQRSSASDKAAQAAITAVTVSGGRSRSSLSQDVSSREAVVTSASAGKQLTIAATQGSIRSQGAKLSSEGDTLLAAKDSIDLGFAADTQNQSGRSRRSGFSIDNRDHLTPFGTFNDTGNAQGSISQITGTSLSSGGRALLQAQTGDLNITGSSVVAQHDLQLSAGRDIRVGSAANTLDSSETQISSGIGSAVISDTEHFSGWMKNTRRSRAGQLIQAKSQLGSLDGSVTIDAGGAYRQQSSDIVARKDIDISAQSIDISAADNTGSRHQSERDVKIGTFAKISSPLIDLVNAAEGAAKSKADDRTRALQGLAAGAQGYQLYDSVGKVAEAAKANALNQAAGASKQQGAALISVEAGFGFKTASKEQNDSYRHHQGSRLAAENIRLHSREGDIRLQGTQAQAADTLRLDSARDILLQSGQDIRHADGKNRNAGVQVGVGVSLGASFGVYIYAEASYGKGHNRLDAANHAPTVLQADQIQLKSRRDTTLYGAQAHARRIDADIGGKLAIESPQDSLDQESKQTGGGLRVQVAWGTAWNVSANYNKSSSEGHSRSVGQQSGLFAGDGGYHIQADSVHLKGGTIASTAPKQQNQLTANRLTFENIANHSSYRADSTGLSAGYGSKTDNPGNGSQNAFTRASEAAGSSMKSDFSHPTALPQHDEGQSQGTTYATLSDGILNIGGRNTTAQEIGIHSDAATAHRQAEALPDLEAVLQRQQIVSKATADIGSGVQAYISRQIRENVAASNQADKDLEIAAANNDEAGVQDALQRRAQAEQNITQWKPGGSKARALGAVTTLITGYLGGQSAQQAAANATAPYAAKVIGDSFSQHGSHPNQAVQLLSHAVLGGFLAQVNGGSFKEGATAAAGAEAVATAITRGLYGEEAARHSDLLNEDEKTLVRDLSAAVGAVASGLSGDSLAAVQRGGVIGRNAVENNQMGATRDIGLSIIGLNPQTAGGVARQINTVRTKLQETGNIEAAMEAGNKVARCDGCYDPAKEYLVALGFGLPVVGVAGATGGTLLAGGSIGLGGGASLGGGATGLIQVGRNVLPWAARTMANPMVKNGLINGGASSGFSALSQYITTGSVNPKEVLFDGTTGFVAGTSSTKASMIFNNPYLRFSTSSVTEIGIYSGSAALKNYAQGKPINRRNVLGAAYAANVGAGSTEVTKNLIDMLPRNNRYFNTLHTTKDLLSPFVGGGVSTLFNMYYNNTSDKVNYRNTRGGKNEK